MVSKEIANKVYSMFGKASHQVLAKFEDYSKQEEWISHDKVLNAILKLSDGDPSRIDKYLNIAKIDPRDVVMLADEA